MSLCNILTAELTCPRCGRQSAMEVELRLGYRNLLRYKLGDTYQWMTEKAVQNGGRPERGEIEAEGYVECPVCQRDFFVQVSVRADVLADVVLAPNKQAYIPD